MNILRLLSMFVFVNACVKCIVIESLTVAALGALGYNFGTIKKHTYCKYKECCAKDFIPHDILLLKDSLQEQLFGQHIVEEKVFQAVASHYKFIDKSQKPLVMSFHGTKGTGKNFVANLIAEAVFEKGTSSKFYHIFHGSQYANNEKVSQHKEAIKMEIANGIGACPYSMFVFDEVDKMPPGVFDSITAMLDHHTLVNGRDFRKAIFIFLTNHGGEEIVKLLFQLTNKKGLYRHETELHHFEEIARIGVYNQEGGLKDSRLIQSAVIDFYLPFLPLEEKHVAKCIETEYRRFGKDEVTSEMIGEIMNYIGFHSQTNYANLGCKTVHPKVKAECE